MPNDILQNDGTPLFEREIRRFTSKMWALEGYFPLVMKLISIKLFGDIKKEEEYINSHGISSSDGEQQEDIVTIPEDKISRFLDIEKSLSSSMAAVELFPINIVMAFVSQYDAYLGRLIKLIYSEKPELLNGSEKNISFAEMNSYTSIQEIKDYIVEKEVESVLRGSHKEHFIWLEKKMNITLTKDLPNFNTFLEIMERRNLFAHNDGVVSSQYLKIIKEYTNDYTANITHGERLKVDVDYFLKCYNVIFEIGVKLGHVIWRKYKPEETSNADTHLINVCFDLIVNEDYNLAINILDFAINTPPLRKNSSQKVICYHTINKALALYLKNNQKACEEVLSQYDWSATGDIFALAVSVLREDYELAFQLMKNIGPNKEELGKEAYLNWPIFKKFRKAEGFSEIYKDVFGEEMVYVEKKPNRLEDILSDLNDVKKMINKNDISI
jgi:hypothetical protein